MLAAGPRDVMVPASGAVAAREVLLEADLVMPAGSGAAVRPARVLVALCAAVALVALIARLGADVLA
jgi:hypothetical protein